jgi:virulence-associated protein VapD
MLSKQQLKNKWDKLRKEYTACQKLLRKQTGVGFNWNTGTINMDHEWWKKITKVSVICHATYTCCLFGISKKILFATS